jgi:indole-3-glycerol phosphate synthase
MLMSILSRIAAYKRKEISVAKALQPFNELVSRLHDVDPPRGFQNALLKAKAEGRYGLIAEIKRASPSKGLIRPDFDPPALARAYEDGGASCLSVLTDFPSFQGDPLYLTQARSVTTLPALRKDFLLDPYQVAQSRLLGADCILVIMAMINDNEAYTLISEANRWGMDALVEVHNEVELERALKLNPTIIGINNRDLNSFVTDIAVSVRLARNVPDGILIVAESGLSTPSDLQHLASFGIMCFLIGESLMRQNDVMKATQELLAR